MLGIYIYRTAAMLVFPILKTTITSVTYFKGDVGRIKQNSYYCIAIHLLL
jgi:hypothetical protein